MLTRLAIAGCALLALVCIPVSAQTLRKIGFIDVPGPKGQRFDYLTLDAEDRDAARTGVLCAPLSSSF
jgi:hypothetical protein